MPRVNPISALVLDDNRELVVHYKKRMERFAGFRVSVETNSMRARALAERQLFDVLVIDAKLEYRGFEFGGLRLAEDLRRRYGSNAILIMSRYITASLAQTSEPGCEFMEKYSGATAKAFERDLCRKLRAMRGHQFAFVAMPFGSEFLPLYRHIRKGVTAAGLKCVRVDKIPHSRPIQEVLFELVEKSKLVVFVADGANPNAYYEAGFADAMRKEVVVVTRSADQLPFDICNRNAIVYGARPTSLEARIRDRILAIRFSRPLVL